jgi:hypothetical protein
VSSLSLPYRTSQAPWDARSSVPKLADTAPHSPSQIDGVCSRPGDKWSLGPSQDLVGFAMILHYIAVSRRKSTCRSDLFDALAASGNRVCTRTASLVVFRSSSRTLERPDVPGADMSVAAKILW